MGANLALISSIGFFHTSHDSRFKHIPLFNQFFDAL